MTPETIVFISSIVLVVVFLAGILYVKLPKRMKHDKFKDSWKQIQGKLKEKEKWNEAIIDADNLLEKALKRKKIKGGSTGEKLVSFQKNLTNNDLTWYGHKLRRKIEAGEKSNLTKDDVKKALVGIGQALKDLGALK